MKKHYYFCIFLLILFSLQSCVVSKHPNMAFFDNPHYDYKDTKFVSINVPMWIAKPVVKKALREDGESEELIALIKKIKDVKIMTIENGNTQMITDFTKYLTKNNFEEWITVKNEKEIINFRAKQKGDEIKELLVTVSSGKDLVYVNVKGKFTADDISKIINYSEKNEVKKIVSK